MTEPAGTFVFLRIGAERFALPAPAVARVVEHAGIAPLAGFPPHLAGIFRDRGGWRPVLDPRPRLGLPVEGPPGETLVLLRRGAAGVWMACREVDRGGRAGAVPEHGGAGVVAGGDTVAVLDLDALLGETDGTEDPMSADIAHAPTDESRTRLLAFRVGGLGCGLDVESVGEVVPCPAIRPLPDAPAFVAGACVLRDAELPVLDLGALLGRPRDAASGGRMLIRIRLAGRDVGLLVDAADGVLSIDPASVVPVAGYLRALARDYLRAIADTEKGLLLVLDPATLLGSDEAAALRTLDHRAAT